MRFLIREGLQREGERLKVLRTFYPGAAAADWRLVDAGIRVQALKKTDQGRIYFGTEVVSSADRSLAALLGASPGASVSANIASQVIQQCFGERLRSPEGYTRMKAMIPSFDLDLTERVTAAAYMDRSQEIDEILGL